jgi:hypothetical protein
MFREKCVVCVCVQRNNKKIMLTYLVHETWRAPHARAACRRRWHGHPPTRCEPSHPGGPAARRLWILWYKKSRDETSKYAVWKTRHNCLVHMTHYSALCVRNILPPYTYDTLAIYGRIVACGRPRAGRAWRTLWSKESGTGGEPFVPRQSTVRESPQLATRTLSSTRSVMTAVEPTMAGVLLESGQAQRGTVAATIRKIVY